MKNMKNIYLILFLFQIYLCLYENSDFPDPPDIPDFHDIPDIPFPSKAEYQLNVKNENGGNIIELIPGSFSKIIFQLTPKNKILIGDYYIFLNETSYKLIIEDENIKTFEKEIIIKPNKDFIFSTYIGLNCQNEIKGLEYKIPLKITHLNDSTEQIPIEYENINIKIRKIKNPINLDIVIKSMPGKSFNFFKISDELYNIDDISFEISQLDDFIFKEIVIKPFGQREELSEKNSENHGILFNYPFGTSKTAEELRKSLFPIKVSIKDNICYKLKDDDFVIRVNKDLPTIINENTKNTFKYYFEDHTPRIHITNNIKLKTIIPVYPVVLTCELYPNSSIKENSTELNKTKIYKNIITNDGIFYITINDIDNYNEYNSNCEITNTNFVKEEINRIFISIGNNIDYDIFHHLIPSRDKNIIPQCANFTFSDKNSFKLFKLYSNNYCRYIMKMNELLSLQSFPTIICKSILDLNDINMNSGTICVATLPSYHNGNFIISKKEFENKFDEFIKKIQNIEIQSYGKIIKVQNVVKYYDIDIDPSSITASISKDESSIIGIKKFVFNVLSTHTYPVQCYYNLNLDENSKIFELEASTNLKPKQSNRIKVGIISTLFDNKMYSLNFNCFNLPGFKYRYKNTGSMIMYTYLNSNIDGLDQLIKFTPSPLTINCNEKINQQNPRCLINQTNPLIEQIQTDIPTYFKEVYDKGQSYGSLSMVAKGQYIKNLVNEFIQNINNSNFKSLLENATSIFNYLSNMDCYLYSSGESNKDSETFQNSNYLKCTKEKKNYFGQMLKSINPYLNCSSLINNITSGLGNDLVENFKYISFLINEMSNSQDSYEKGLSQILFNLSFCLQDNFDKYWENIVLYLKDKKQYLNESIDLVKKDALITIFQSLINLAKIIHFEEMDGYIKGTKTNNGLFFSDIGKTIENKIIEFSKKFNELGDGDYYFSGSTFLKVESNKELRADNDTDMQIINIQDKSILIKIYSNYMIRKNNAKYLQILVFDSPLVSVKTNGKKDESSDSVLIFVNIILYDEQNEEISINSIENKYKPEILYLKSTYNSLKKCFYYNEEKKELVGDGIIIDENYEYDGQKYFKCASNHLTAFTAGTYNFNNNLSWWIPLLIILAILLALLFFVFIFIIVKKMKMNKNRIRQNDTNSNFEKTIEMNVIN